MYHRFITKHPNSPMVDEAQKSRAAIALREVKARSLGGFRPAAMRFIAEAFAGTRITNSLFRARHIEKAPMKIAVFNFSGNMGKSTVARHLLLPRIPGTEPITSESLNADEGQGQALRGRQFRS